MQKAATGWLYDQLRHHPDFWMPPIKQMHYLEREKTPVGNAEKLLGKVGNQRLANRKRWDERDIAFLEQVMAYRGLPTTIERYASLFRHKGELLSGEINSGYSGLPEAMISRVAEQLPGLRVFLIVRDPVARAWSQISMAYRNDSFDLRLLEDMNSFRSYLKTSPEIQKVAYPAQIAARWMQAGSSLDLAWFFFDDIVEGPEKVRGEILSFLGADPGKASGDLAAGHNRKSQDQKLECTEATRSVLIEHFADELRASASLFGGPAKSWAASYALA